MAGEDASPFDFDPSEEYPLEGVAAGGDACPCPPGEVIRILGIHIDGYIQLGEHFEYLLVKSASKAGNSEESQSVLGASWLGCLKWRAMHWSVAF